MSKALVILRKGQRLTANQNRTIYHTFHLVKEISTPSTRPLVHDELTHFLPTIIKALKDSQYPNRLKADHVVLTYDDPLLLRDLAYWAGMRWASDTHSENFVKILFTPDVGPGGSPADSGWEIV